MTAEYPYNSPLLLNDNVYTGYGGFTGSSTALQRNNSYLMAEIQVSYNIGTLLVPTVVTGTYMTPRFGYPVVTDWGEVKAINSVLVFARNSFWTADLTKLAVCAYIRDNTFGYLDPSCIINYASNISMLNPYQIQVVYQCGFSTGTSMQPNMMQALTWAADINLKDMISPSSLEGGAGDPGVQRFSAQSYMEERTPLIRTDFGSSPRANKIKRYLNAYTRTPGIMLGRL
jgi:hypothetical protein